MLDENRAQLQQWFTAELAKAFDLMKAHVGSQVEQREARVTDHLDRR